MNTIKAIVIGVFAWILAIGFYSASYALPFLETFDRPAMGQAPSSATKPSGSDQLKLEAFAILNAKCNSCHKRQNPFMVFSLKNMEKRAAKINQQVFVKRRMPKGNQTRLTSAEYETLKKWLSTQTKR